MKDPIESPQDMAGGQPAEGTVDRRRLVANFVVIAITLLAVGIVRPGVLVVTAVLGSIVLMIMLHELGHFVMAKRAGMKVTEYFLGFGPRVWSFRRGETEYGIKAIPAGGYVRIIGMNNLEEVDPVDEPRTYRAQAYRHRLGVAVAGSTVHFILAVTLLFIVFAFVGEVRDTRPPVVDNVIEGTPAVAAGLRSGDVIVGVDGREVREWMQVVDYIKPRAGDEIAFTILRDGREREIRVVPKSVRSPSGKRVGFVGLGVSTYNDPMPVPTAASESLTRSVTLARDSLTTLGDFFTPSGLERYWDVVTTGKSEPTDTRFLSPIGAGRVAGQAAGSGWGEVLGLLAAINVFVGVFNMVPLLPLDGGHVAIATYEKIASTIRRRRVVVDVTRLLPITVAVLAVFVLLGLTSLYLDVVDPIPNPY